MEDSMSEEKTQATTETVSESPAQETDQNSSNDQYIAESKKYRKRAQDAEAQLAKLEKSLKAAENDKLKKKEEFKTLYEQASSENEKLSAKAEKWAKYEETKRASLLESHPEDERESLSNLDLETLEYVTNKINSRKPNAPEQAGQARTSAPEIKLSDFNKMTKQEKKENWAKYMNQYKK